MSSKYSQMPEVMKVLAIDPGYDRFGIAVVEGDPSHPHFLWSDCVLPPKGVASTRLAYISKALSEAIATHAPDAIGMETLFFSINKKTALQVAEVRGVVIAAAGLNKIPLIECSPQAVKLAVTGYGNADKKAVAQMVPRLITLPEKKRLDDEIDAIAVGITALAIGLPRT